MLHRNQSHASVAAMDPHHRFCVNGKTFITCRDCAGNVGRGGICAACRGNGFNSFVCPHCNPAPPSTSANTPAAVPPSQHHTHRSAAAAGSGPHADSAPPRTRE